MVEAEVDKTWAPHVEVSVLALPPSNIGGRSPAWRWSAQMLRGFRHSGVCTLKRRGKRVTKEIKKQSTKKEVGKHAAYSTVVALQEEKVQYIHKHTGSEHFLGSSHPSGRTPRRGARST